MLFMVIMPVEQIQETITQFMDHMQHIQILAIITLFMAIMQEELILGIIIQFMDQMQVIRIQVQEMLFLGRIADIEIREITMCFKVIIQGITMMKVTIMC